jgi:hypothetical protein
MLGEIAIGIALLGLGMGALPNIRDIERAAREQGWRVELTTKGHVRYIPTDKSKKIVIHGGTPSDHRSTRNLIAALRRSGLVI